MTDMHPTLNAALAAFQAELPGVRKAHTAKIPGKDGKQGYSYEYADLKDISDAAYPVLTRHGLSFSVCPRRTEAGGYEAVGVLMHETGTSVESALPLHGTNAQAIGSSLTYMRRYLLCAVTGIVADDDDEAAASQGQAQTWQAPPPPVRPLPTTDDPEQLADTAEALGKLSEIARSQDPPRTVEWITSKLRREAGNLSVDDLARLSPGPLWELVSRWQAKD